jgi:single-stranded-DNA-specific exonuclease
MKWNVLSKKSGTTTTNDKVLITLLANRGLKTKKQQEEFLNPSLKLLDVNFFNNRQFIKACERIKKAIQNKEQIIVYSDYDVDGITGTAILWETLHSLKARTMPFVPDRIKHGYGLSAKGIEEMVQAFPETKLVITVDNGITAKKEIEELQNRGIDVIITDHHTIPPEKPRAYAIIHSLALSGSGVALAFTHLLSQWIKKSASEWNQEHLALAALGTIADLVPLLGPNRVIATFGLAALNNTKRLGLKALIAVSGLTGQSIEAYHVGYVIAPRINASGRLSHGLEALQLLCTHDSKRAIRLASHLNTLNSNRQESTHEAYIHAEHHRGKNEKLLFVSHESYHEGIIGLVAGNLVESFYRPAIVISIGKELSKASARSIRGVNIHTLLSKASYLFQNFGGHPMAAGFSVYTNQLEELEKKLIEIFTAEIPDSLLEPELRIDMKLPLSEVSNNLFQKIHTMRPFGVGNPEPVFVSDQVFVANARTVGKDGKHLRVTITTDQLHNNTITGIGFNLGDKYPLLESGEMVDVAYSITENIWNGKKSLQLKLKDLNFTHKNSF